MSPRPQRKQLVANHGNAVEVRREFDTCDWVRGAPINEVLQEALRKWDNDDASALKRLLTDPRMARVYRELRKRKRVDHRPTREPFHTGSWLKDELKGQDDRIQYLMLQAALARNPRVVAKAEVVRRRRMLLELAGCVRAIAELPWFAIDTAVRTKDGFLPFQASARFSSFAAYVESLNMTDRVVVVAQGRSPKAKCTVYLRILADISRKLFGVAMPRVVATIANVVLNRDDITEATVRGALKTR